MRTIHTKLIKTLSWIILSSFLISLPAYSAEVDLLAEIEPTLQVVVPTSVSLNLTPNLDGSPVFVKEDLNILVATNNPTGYHLSLQTNSTNLINNAKDKDGNYPILETISSELSEENFTTNRWGYKQDDANNTKNYLPFQTNINLNQTTSPTNQDDITLTFAAKADITKPAGTYSLALDFQAVTNMIPGVETIIFNPNGGEGTMANQQIEAGTSQNLNQNQFTRTDYTFLYWNTEPDNTGTTYTDKQLQNVTLSTNNTNLTLYAQWASNYMQDFTLANCKTLATDNPHTLIDRRDNNDYTVRYIEGNCWMTRNLRLGMGKELTPNDSNVAENYTTTTVDLTVGSSSIEARIHVGDIVTGNWYNYVAATAGTIFGDTNGEPARYDLCPKGWSLPSSEKVLTIAGSSVGENNFMETYVNQFSPVASGNYTAGQWNNYNIFGFWWVNDGREGNYRFNLTYNQGDESKEEGLALGGSSRHVGISIRCILKN